MLDHLVEDRIQAAIARGELDRLPGAGRPLELDDDRLVPQHLRAGYRILKNAGYLPPELEPLRELRRVEAEMRRRSGEGDANERGSRLRLMLLLGRLDAAGLAHTSRAVLREYEAKLFARLGSTHDRG